MYKCPNYFCPRLYLGKKNSNMNVQKGSKLPKSPNDMIATKNEAVNNKPKNYFNFKSKFKY